ncbi:MAG: AEC family transporter [Rhizobiales bacterium]|nr:AEC family transporter [Hyphomicrobiales bacterium]
MLLTSLSVLLPVLFVILLGYWAGRSHRFDADQVKGINALVLDFAFPALMFVGISSTTRREMLAEMPFLLALFIGFAGFYVLALLIGRHLLRHNLGAAALLACSVSFPSVAFMGVPIFKDLFGHSSLLSVSAANALGILIVVPATVVLLEIDASRAKLAGASAAPVKDDHVIRSALISSFRKPVVWAPLLAFLLVLVDLRVPAEMESMLRLIGATTSGVALFASGLVSAAFKLKIDLEIIGNVIAKMVIQPLCMVAIVFLIGVSAPLSHEAILICAIPTAVFPSLLAPRYDVYVSECASTLILTTIVMVVTFPLALMLVGT